MKGDGMDIELNEGAEIARSLAKQWLTESELIPLSVLGLDYPEPLDGWEPLLQARGIELLTDDLYRPAIRREDARRRRKEAEAAEQLADNPWQSLRDGTDKRTNFLSPSPAVSSTPAPIEELLRRGGDGPEPRHGTHTHDLEQPGA